MLRVIILLTVFMLILPRTCAGQEQNGVQSDSSSKLEFLPILSYDTDAGVGYGIKSFFLNYLHTDESFDVVLFNSTRGERWYRAVYSLPDFERRQGTVYPLALDLTIDYDKWIGYNFFGVGNTSSYANKEAYTREPLEMSAQLSRGFSEQWVGQLAVRYRTVRNFGFQDDSRLAALAPALNAGRATFVSLQGTIRYDTRNSFINPSSGIVLQGEVEESPSWSLGNVSFTRYAIWTQAYVPVLVPQTVLAVRGGLQDVSGDNLPIQVMLPIGGGSTLRGYPQDRFLGPVSAVMNVELRFPIIWRFGGIAGYDVGRVFGDIGQLGFATWRGNPMAGLRFYFDTFVVRLDVGFGPETTGFYLNFGQLF